MVQHISLLLKIIQNTETVVTDQNKNYIQVQWCFFSGFDIFTFAVVRLFV